MKPHPLFHHATNGGTSEVVIASTARPPRFTDRKVAVLHGAHVRLDQNGYGVVEMKFPTGRDDEGDRAYLAHYEITDLTFRSCDENMFSFTGWLKAAKFYRPGEAPADTDSKPVPYTPPSQMEDGQHIRVEVEAWIPGDAEALEQFHERVESNWWVNS